MDPEENYDSIDETPRERPLPDYDSRREREPSYRDPWQEPSYRSAPEYRDRLYTPGVTGYRDFSHSRTGRREHPQELSAGGVVLGILLLVLFSIAIGSAVGYAAVNRAQTGGDITVHRQVVLGASMAPAGTGAGYDAEKEEGRPASDIYDEACLHVVGITTTLETRNIFGMVSQSAVSGTGFIITSDGYILTNHHVIEYALAYKTNPTVVLYDGTSYTAKVVGYYENNDLALLKIEETGLVPAQLGDSASVTVGDRIYCVGNPLGELDFSMTHGVVSALDRSLRRKDGTEVTMLQIDAAVNSGNSGGPVYDRQGRVIGIVTSKMVSSGVEGLGFAIPINDAMEVVSELMQYGYVTGQASLGVSVQTVSPAAAQFYRLHVGAMVDTVEEGSCGEAAGLRSGDVITGLGEAEITSSETYLAALRSHRAGDVVQVTVFRQGEKELLTFTVTLDELVPKDLE